MPRPRLPIGAHGEINLDQIAPGKWRARTLYRFEDGKRRQVERTAKTKAAAENRLKSALVDIETPQPRAEMTVSDLIAEYLEAQKKAKLSPNTLKAYRAYCKNVEAGLGAHLVKQVKTMRVQKFLDDLTESSGAGSAAGARTVLSGMFNLAIRHDLITHNPVSSAKGAKQSGRRGAKGLPADQIALMMQRIRQVDDLVERDFCDLWEFMSLVGSRIAETCGITESMVFFDKQAVTIGPSVARETGGAPFLYEDAKTEESKRTVVIPKRAMHIIERRLEMRPWTKEGAIFPDPLGGLYFPGKVEQLWARHRAAVGFPEFTSHGFRKSVATMLDEAHMSPRDIAEYLGHKKPSMTMDVYMDLNKQSAMMAEVIEGKFGVSSESPSAKGAKVA